MAAEKNYQTVNKPFKVAVLSFELPSFACALIRLIYPLRYLQTEVEFAWAVGFDGRQFHIHARTLANADLVIVQRQFPCAATAKMLQHVLSLGKPVIYETDDLLTDIPADNPIHHYTQQNRALLIEFLARVNAITTSTEPLVQALSEYNKNVHLLPNLLDISLWPKSRTAETKDTIVLGFTGTPTHQHDLGLIEEALFRIADMHRNRVAFVFMGCITERLRQLPHCTYQEFRPAYEEYTRILPRLGIDIAVVPLLDIQFNHLKSDIKWLEYSACNIPGIFADLPPYRNSIRHMETGMLAGYALDPWVESLDRLIRDQELRATMAAAARLEVQSKHSLQCKAVQYLHVYRSVLEQAKP